MKLNYKIFGEGEPLVIMHGLYGSLDNWVGIARELQSDFKVVLVDLRNHGRSPHDVNHNYELMADDILELFNDLQIYEASIMGHSMGGKVALAFSIFNPERVRRLVVVDISFRTYKVSEGDIQFAEHVNILDALLSVDLNGMKTRDEVDVFLAGTIQNDRVRTFLLKNLYRTSDKQFNWRLNLTVLRENLEKVLEGFEKYADEIKRLERPVLFIKGGNSPYISSNDEMLIVGSFPNARVEVIKDASHWVHAEKTNEFISMVRSFCV